ncbi:MAG: hypothetical protein JO208_10860 [Alphaproteobacteria bacterium]|nr:hypothetical protein [Alphaproteobacteria bacterium]
MRAFLPIMLTATLALLGGCDQKQSANIEVKDKGGSVTISANGQHFSMRGNDGSHGEVTISGNGDHVTMHAGDGQSVVDINAGGVNVSGKLPGFVSVYPGAKVVSLVTGNNQSGTLVMQTGAAPAEVVGFYKQKAQSAGFTQKLDANDAGNLLYSATFAGRAMQVLASKDSEGTHAQVTWSSQ